ncbi:DUF262 domain-containing protein [uncultured Acetobacterium sp.]|uniref:DUF262 domain-containing protein n=1 Tax=uncultured Acetobacterium sp. TaxID=217139 RepID=UPI0025D93D47|nr:DUF262 domain-containing protein [uncultured Acetobacterium sp.]
MIMESFITSVDEFFKMNKTNEPNFDQNRLRYVIPKYQREYKWDSERVITLFNDINNRDKFLGNIILNKVSDYYEIVDGQQRITTIMLFLLALYNKNRNPTETDLSEEQKVIAEYLKRNGKLVLENDTIGEYLKENSNSIHIDIKDESDIYFQKSTFNELYLKIASELDGIADFLNFQKKVLDCQFLVLIGETGGRQNDSIEEIFLDINFKSQLLDVSDIFKGYCFKNYFPANHEELKSQWTDIRRYTKLFEIFGYKDTKDTSQYLYYYLLSKPSTYSITENLSPRGKHFLEGKNNTETKALLQDMIAYGNHITTFSDNLAKESYTFEDICLDAKSHKYEAHNNKILRQMSQNILFNKSATYQKFPLFMCIHYLLGDDELKNNITYPEFKKLITNYFSYSFLFIVSSHSKVKRYIDHTIIDELNNTEKNAKDKIASIIMAIKTLRAAYLNDYIQFRTYKSDIAYFLFSITDNYVANENFLKDLYCKENAYSREHLLIHDNSEMNITWIHPTNKFTFSMKKLLSESKSNLKPSSHLKNQMTNCLILNRELNEKLDQKDIVEKISLMKEFYLTNVPNHVQLYINHIEALSSYIELASHKEKNQSIDVIKEQYKIFIFDYFSDEQQDKLYDSITSALQETFQNNN